MDYKLVLSHPTSNQNVRWLAEGLCTHGLLDRFYTGIACFSDDFYYPLLRGPFKSFRRRDFSNRLKNHIRTFPTYEIGRQLASVFGTHFLLTHETGLFSIDNVYRSFDAHVSKKIDDASSVYAYEDGALNSFQKAKKTGIICLYDLPIGYWRAAQILMKEEYEQNPAWAPTLTGFKDSNGKLERKDDELRLADHIFVASSFTRNTLYEYPGALAPVSVIPYGFPPIADEKEYSSLKKRPLRLLFVGGLSQRKGISYLFEAVEGLGEQVTLTVVGKKSVDDCEALNAALSRHHWIPSMPHTEILQLMRNHDVLVFPSLFEGFGLVITEAMSQGTPVITTERTAGPDLIRHNENGWLVKAGSAVALREQIEALLAQPTAIARNGRAARDTARKRPWTTYGTETAAAIRSVLENGVNRINQ